MKLFTVGQITVFLLAASMTVGLGAQESATSRSAPPAIRIWGYQGLAPVLVRWESAYQKMHPGIRFDNHLNAPATVMAGLYDGVADFALMGREIWPVETMAYHWVYQQQPFGLIVLTAGLNAPGQSFTPVIVVNPANPLHSITLSQLDAIYGSEHRIAPANIRTWGDLGLTGKWASQPIHAYGFGPEDSLGVFFRHDVLHNDFKPNPTSQLLSDRGQDKTSASQRIARAVARDPYAIGYTSLGASSATKVLAVGPQGGQIFPSESTVASHRYPLTRSLSIYFRRFPGKRLDPRLDEFLRYLLSPEAQALVRPTEGFVPLSESIASQQLKKLDAPVPATSATDWKEK